MIELPESVTIARQLNQVFRNKTIVAAVAAATPHQFAFYHGSPAEYSFMLTGETVFDVNHMGGYVEIALKRYHIILGEDLIVNCLDHKTKLPVRHQLLLEFDDGLKLAVTVRMCGDLYVVPAGEYTTVHHLQAHARPCPLTEAFDEPYFETLTTGLKQNTSIKAFLTTEQRIPGLGNGVLQDILFNAKLNPKTKYKALNTSQKERLFKSIKNTLTAMTAQGGRNTEKDIYDNRGGYYGFLTANTCQKPCPACGNAIVKQAYMGGTVYFCPACQPL